MPDWLQELYDLLANETIKLIIEGEFNSINAQLFIVDIVHSERLVGEVYDAVSIEEAVIELILQYRKRGR